MLSVEHRGAVLEISRGLSDRRERYPRNMTTKKQGTLEGCQTKLSDPSGVECVVGIEFRGYRRFAPQPPANFWQPSGLQAASKKFLRLFFRST